MRRSRVLCARRRMRRGAQLDSQLRCGAWPRSGQGLPAGVEKIHVRVAGGRVRPPVFSKLESAIGVLCPLRVLVQHRERLCPASYSGRDLMRSFRLRLILALITGITLVSVASTYFE